MRVYEWKAERMSVNRDGTIDGRKIHKIDIGVIWGSLSVAGDTGFTVWSQRSLFLIPWVLPR